MRQVEAKSDCHERLEATTWTVVDVKSTRMIKQRTTVVGQIVRPCTTFGFYGERDVEDDDRRW